MMIERTIVCDMPGCGNSAAWKSTSGQGIPPGWVVIEEIRRSTPDKLEVVEMMGFHVCPACDARNFFGFEREEEADW
jgi:hypothetical protein